MRLLTSRPRLKTMRKRSKYRPKGVRLDPIGYITEGFKPVMEHESFAVDLKLKNHNALVELTQGRADKSSINILISALNITESLWRLGFGVEYRQVVDEGIRALRDVGRRGLASGSFVLRSEEMAALTTAMELHDAQLEVMTIRDMERALAIVQEEIRNKRCTAIEVKT